MPKRAAKADLVAWLRLICDFNWSERQKRALLSVYQTPSAVFKASAGELSSLTKQTYQSHKAVKPEVVQRNLDWLAQEDCHLITCNDVAYPDLLTHLSDPPIALYAKGNPQLLKRHQVAIVGSRRPSPVGEKVSCTLATELAEAGLVITSGMALGVDAAAHTAVLDLEMPTIAVMGCGLDRVYPLRHQALFSSIAKYGLLLSEYPLGAPPRANHFPQRNRIISGLSLGVVVIEAALESGTMITAKLALEQNREVFVVPGSFVSKQYAGSHQLIRDGAILIRNSQDILQEFTVSLQQVLKNRPKIDNKGLVDHEILDFVEYEPTLIDDIILASGLTAAQVSSMLLLLEVEGRVAVTDEGRYIRVV